MTIIYKNLRKATIDNIKKSEMYRQNAEVELRKIMERDPYIGLSSLVKQTGYSKQTISNAYLRIRKSSEWKTWKNNYISN